MHVYKLCQLVTWQGVGYAIVCGFGAFFAVVTTLAMELDKRFAGSVYHSEEFNTAGRAIKTGLSAVDVLSRATWYLQCHMFSWTISREFMSMNLDIYVMRQVSTLKVGMESICT